MVRSNENPPATDVPQTLSSDGRNPGRERRAPRNGPPREFHGYQIMDWLGEGAMGEVYLARDRQVRRDVAIKFVKDNTTRT